MKLTREVQPARHLIGRRIIVATLWCLAALLASQVVGVYVRGPAPSRLDATIARDPLPGRWR